MRSERAFATEIAQHAHLRQADPKMGPIILHRPLEQGTGKRVDAEVDRLLLLGSASLAQCVVSMSGGGRASGYHRATPAVRAVQNISSSLRSSANSAGSPSNTLTPRFSTAARVAIARPCFRFCSTSRIVVP